MRRAAGTAVVAFVLVALAAPVGLAGAPAELLPDLIVRRASGLAIRSVSGGRERLRFTTTTVNLGVGVLELHPRKDDCDGDGDFEDDRTALQRTFLDRNGNGRFDPSTDPMSREL